MIALIIAQMFLVPAIAIATRAVNVALEVGKMKYVSLDIALVASLVTENLALKAKGVADVILNEKEFSELERDPKKVRIFSQSIDFVVAEAPLMMRIGKSLGKVLGPHGKMPKPLPPHADATPMINKLKETVKVSLKENPTISCTIGTEKMTEDELEKNLAAMLGAIEKKFPLGKQNMKEVLVKSTMGPPVKVDY